MRPVLPEATRYLAIVSKSLDMTLSVNGMPMVTLELKNPLTGQTVEDVMQQYRQDRDPRERIFDFKKRTLVHFAVDTEAVYMTTRLGRCCNTLSTVHRGSDGGAGNPPDPQGGRIARPICGKRSCSATACLDLLARFSPLQIDERITDEGKKVKKENFYMPTLSPAPGSSANL